MSKADEMFEKLDYKKVEDSINEVIYEKGTNIRENEWYGSIHRIIITKNQNGTFIEKQDDKGYEVVTDIFEAEEIQAINEKCNEMGWIE